MKNINKIVHLFLTNSNINLNNKEIIVGYSGGADSTALLHILNEKKQHFNYNLKAVFFSHEGTPLIEDEKSLIEHCEYFCKQLNIPLHIQYLNLIKINNQSWESSGRHGRMNFYDQLKPDYVFLGHHKNDQDETTMIQLFRGAGKGILGMKAIDGIYVRPFLNITKNDIYEYLKFKNISWIEDTTNENNELTRNFWRNIGLPTVNKYYPDYSARLDNVREKFSNLFELSKELALIDGLNDLIEEKSINISNLTHTRVCNLINNYFRHYGYSLENKTLKDKIENNKHIIIEKNDLVLNILNNNIWTCKKKLNNKKNII